MALGGNGGSFRRGRGAPPPNHRCPPRSSRSVRPSSDRDPALRRGSVEKAPAIGAVKAQNVPCLGGVPPELVEMCSYSATEDTHTLDIAALYQTRPRSRTCGRCGRGAYRSGSTERNTRRVRSPRRPAAVRVVQNQDALGRRARTLGNLTVLTAPGPTVKFVDRNIKALRVLLRLG